MNRNEPCHEIICSWQSEKSDQHVHILCLDSISICLYCHDFECSSFLLLKPCRPVCVQPIQAKTYFLVM